MNIDKQNGNIAFNEEEHIYWDVVTGTRYISVTTLIGKYHEKFDSYFWSRYKAYEALDPENFNKDRKELLTTKKWNVKYETHPDFEEKVKEILDSYKKANEEACEKGTRMHLEKEMLAYSDNHEAFKKYGLNKQYYCKKNDYDFTKENGIYPEMLLTFKDKENVVHLAGQSDLVVKEGKTIHIYDFKTNKKLDKESYYDKVKKSHKMMFSPLNHIMDCNLMHYEVQLSIYAYMLENQFPDHKIGNLIIIYLKDDGTEELFELKYRRQEVINLLKHYKKKIYIENERSKRNFSIKPEKK